MTPTAKRDLVLDFPVVYHYAIGSLAVHKDNASIPVPADASGKRIGVMKATNDELYIRREQTVDAMREDGTLGVLSLKWFSVDRTTD